MCYTHTLYYTACGCYSKPQIYGEPCIRAVKGQGLSSRGCWDTIDYGLDSVDEACRRCQRTSLSSSSDDRRLSDTTTLEDSRRPSDASSTSSNSEAQDEVRGGPSDCPRTAPLTPPGAMIKRPPSTSSLSSISSAASSASPSERARCLLICLPTNIPTIKRCPSGVSLSDNYAEISQSAKAREGADNSHWRAYNSGLFMDGCVVSSA